MRLLVFVTQEQNASQLLWRPLRIAVDIGEKKTDGPLVRNERMAHQAYGAGRPLLHI